MKKTILSLVFIFALFFSAKAQFSQDFEDGFFPAGWSVFNGGDATQWHIGVPYMGTGHSGTKVAKLAGEIGVAHNDYLITSQIHVTANVNDRITFWVRNDNVPQGQHLNVKISTTTPDETGFATFLITDTTPTTLWVRKTISLSAYIGQDVYIGFQAFSTSQGSIFIDDVVNDTTPVCNLTAPVISSVSAPADCNVGNVTISLTGLPATGTWTLYRTGTSSSSVTGTGTSTTVTVSNPDITGYYRFYVKDINLCQSPNSETVTLNPLHDIDIYAPMAGTYADSNSNGIVDAGDTINYLIEVHNSGFCSLSNTSVNGVTDAYNPNLSFSGNPITNILTIAGNTTISVPATYVITQNDINAGQVENGTMVNAHWPGQSTAYYPSCILLFTNLSTGNFVFETLKYSPNPVKNYLSVSNANAIDAIEITSVLGQKVFSKKVNGLQDELDLAPLKKGIYFVRVLSKGFEKTFKIIKE